MCQIFSVAAIINSNNKNTNYNIIKETRPIPARGGGHPTRWGGVGGDVTLVCLHTWEPWCLIMRYSLKSMSMHCNAFSDLNYNPVIPIYPPNGTTR